MPAYAVLEIDVTDPDRYRAYQKLSEAAVKQHGGRFLVRGGAPETLEGGWAPPRVAVIEFADRATAEQWYGSREYREARAARAGAANVRAVVVDGYAVSP